MSNTLKAEKKIIGIELDFKKIFIHLSNIIISAATVDLSGVMKELIETAVEIFANNTPENAAYKLLTITMTKAVTTLIKELDRDVFPANVKETEKQLSGSFKLTNLTLDNTFFDKPYGSEPVKKMQDILSSWLKEMNVKPDDIKVIVNRFESYIVYELYNEWRANKDKYTIIWDSLKTPFDDAVRRDYEWKCYRAYLQNQMNKGVFNEKFSLKDIYIPLNAHYIKQNNKEFNNKRIDNNFDDIKEINVNTEIYLNKWLQKDDKTDTVRIISGAPGSGKYSFAKMFACNISDKYKVIFIKLHLFNFESSIKDAVGEYFSEHFSYNPLDEDKLVIIFDGLDELSQQGKACTELAKQFAEKIDHYVAIRNDKSLHVQVLITGRHLAVQSSQVIFEKEEQILYLDPYSETQRNAWWKKYGHFSEKEKYQRFPEELKKDKLNDLSTIPLLNYLIALSYESGKIDFTKTVNLNNIYENLIDNVFKRGYNDHNSLVRGIKKDDFISFLEEIAISVWHNSTGTTTITEIKNHCEQSSLPIEQFKEDAEKGIFNLLTAFYFKKSDKIQGEETFEFTHKSFREYLVAKRIVRQLEWMQEDLLTNEKKSRRKTKPEEDVLQDWISLCGQTGLDDDIFSFIRDEIILLSEEKNGKELISEWQKMLCNLISYMLKNGMPFEAFPTRDSFYEETRQSRNAEEALLVCLSACSMVTDEISNIDWGEDRTTAGAWINKLRGQRDRPNVFVLKFLNHLNLQNCALYISDLYEANLYKANVNKAALYISNLTGANLTGANLSGANLNRANLSGANLHEAKLLKSDLKAIDLKLSGAKNYDEIVVIDD